MAWRQRNLTRMKLSKILKSLLLTVLPLSIAANAFGQLQVDANIKIYQFSQESSFSPFGGASKKKAENRYWYRNGSTWSSFSDNDGQRININYKGSPLMLIYKKVGSDDTDKSFSPVAEIQLPKDSRDIFVLMISVGQSASFYPINMSPDRLPKGKIAVMNMTRRALGIMFGKDQKPLRPNGNAILSEPPKFKGMSVPVKIAAKVQGKWEISYNSRVSYPKDERCLMLIYDTSEKEVPNLNINIVQF